MVLATQRPMLWPHQRPTNLHRHRLQLPGSPRENQCALLKDRELGLFSPPNKSTEFTVSNPCHSNNKENTKTLGNEEREEEKDNKEKLSQN